MCILHEDMCREIMSALKLSPEHEEKMSVSLLQHAFVDTLKSTDANQGALPHYVDMKLQLDNFLFHPNLMRWP